MSDALSELTDMVNTILFGIAFENPADCPSEITAIIADLDADVDVLDALLALSGEQFNRLYWHYLRH